MMNIFAVDHDPAVAATMLCDKHVVKMVTESAQLLSTAHRVAGDSPDGIYKATHPNHPSNIWIRQSSANYRWLYEHFIALCNEYTARYHKVHKCYQLADVLSTTPSKIVDGPMTPFAVVMPDQYKVQSPVESYRNLYLGDKARFAKWKNNNAPKWFTSRVALPSLSAIRRDQESLSY
jgi:thioester reductase-like protein